jgi:hypothetical protein
MNCAKTLVALYSCLIALNVQASDTKQKTDVLTLSGGKYIEVFDQDSIEQIGDVLYNVNSEKIIGFVKSDNVETKGILKPQIISRWFSPDPAAAKSPYESPYVYCGNNPIIYTDPDGKEKVIVIGGGDASANDRYKFINSGVGQMLNYARNNSSHEPITLVVTDIFVESKSLEFMQAWANATAINYGAPVNIVIAKSGDDITNYINSKSSSSPDITAERKSDPITSLSFFGHGYPWLYASQTGVDGFEPGHGTPGEEYAYPVARPEHDKWAWGIQDAGAIDPNAFSENSSVDFYSCNAATPNNSGVSLASALSAQLGNKATVSGFYGKTSYEKIYKGGGWWREQVVRTSMFFSGGLYPANNLPSAGTKSPGFGTGASEQNHFRNGKKQ